MSRSRPHPSQEPPHGHARSEGETGTSAPGGLVVHGSVAPGFEAVRDAFIENFTLRHELGAACCVYQDGEKVVDLWGGLRDPASRKPWRENTMAIVHSATKGMAALVMALAHSRRWLDHDERVSRYWPEFAQNGKDHITLRQLLGHQAALFAFDEPVDRDVVADLDRLAAVMERQRPAWEPGELQAYHAITLGFYEGEIIRRVDPKHRTLGRVFADEIAGPLGIDFYIGVPDSIPDEQIAPLEAPGVLKRILGMPLSLTLDAMRPGSVLHRSLVANPGTQFYLDPERVVVRNLEVPSGGGVGTARALARAYGAFASGGAELGLAPDTLAALAAPASPAGKGFFDACFHGDAHFSLGFMKPCETFPFGSPGSYGAPGAGGAMGYADPEAGIGYGYVTSRMGTSLQGDPRDVALRTALPAAPRKSGR